MNSVQKILQNHQLQGLTRLFAATNDGNVMQFLSQKIKLGGRIVDVPVIVLVSHHLPCNGQCGNKFKAKVGSVEAQELLMNSMADMC